MVCNVCNENKRSTQFMPCCEGKKLCQTCLVSLVKKECPFCHKNFTLRKGLKSVRRCTCKEFWSTFYHISYLIFQLAAIGLASYDLHVDKNSDLHIIDNVLAVIIPVVSVLWWYIVEIRRANGNICHMAVSLYGMPWIMGQQLIWSVMYATPLNGTFLASAFAAWLMLLALSISLCIGVLIYHIINYCCRSLSYIYKNCGHIEDREDSKVTVVVE